MVPLAKCALLRVAILPSDVAPAVLAGLALPASKLELLSVDLDGIHAPQPLSAIAPFVAAGLTRLDLHGFELDVAASSDVLAVANRLTVGAARKELPRAQLLQCTRLVD